MFKVSLIITVFNRTHLLRKALISLSRQSDMPDELILSDDGSDEDVVSGISDLIRLFNFPVKFVSQKKDGFRLAKCRNNGVKHSEGDYLIFLDQDLIHTNDFIKVFVENKKPKHFITSYPIRLSKEQSDLITEEKIAQEKYDSLILKEQKAKIISQYRKDKLGEILTKLKLETKPKIRGGACAINREDYYYVNGYDENFKAWGNEDDDIKRRLYKIGVRGINPFYNQYPLHLYHEPFHINGKRENQEYTDKRKKEIESGDFRCEYGIESPFCDEKISVVELN